MKNDGANFLLGALIGGFAAYYAIKHKDEIMERLSEIGEDFDLQNNEHLLNAKEKLGTFVQSVTSGVNSLVDDEKEKLKAELDALKVEMAALRAQ